MTVTYRNAGGASSPIPSDVSGYQPVMFALLLRNVASTGWVFTDPGGNDSLPGAIIASPSFQTNDPLTNQDYVFNWTRDAAIAAFELAVAPVPWMGLASAADYVSFARSCQTNAMATDDSIARACYLVNGTPRSWTDQNDGPALQTLAILSLWPHLPPATQAMARQVIQSNIDYLLANANYQAPTTNLWEEAKGLSFFAQSIILRCFNSVAAQNTALALGLDANGLNGAIAALNDPKTGMLATFWDAANSRYASMIQATANDGGSYAGSGVNVDVVMASIYGAVTCTDPRLLSSAAQVRNTFVTGDYKYPINAQDASLGMGPMIGRYPGDVYDGDVGDGNSGIDHPWAPCTANVAQLYYQVAAAVESAGAIPADALSATFFSQIGIGADTSPADAVNLLRDAGDDMLQALIYHSDFLELSEQFDGTTGFEKSVRNLTWSYAAFLSALRARP
jgi:glucoamylase